MPARNPILDVDDLQLSNGLGVRLQPLRPNEAQDHKRRRLEIDIGSKPVAAGRTIERLHRQAQDPPGAQIKRLKSVKQGYQGNVQ